LGPVAAVLSGDADMFAVARAEEAFAASRAAPGVKVLVLGVVEAAYAGDLIDTGVYFTVSSMDELKLLDGIARKRRKSALVHVKVDTGMRRLGAPPAEAARIFGALAGFASVRVEGVYTHFADEGGDFSREQFRIFSEIAPQNCVRHCANSYHALNCPEYRLDMVRPGIALYGYGAGLKPAVSWTAEIIQVNAVEAGETVGYGRRYAAPAPREIAVVNAGYGDGFPRLINTGTVRVRGRDCPIVGSVCMDMLFTDVTGLGAKPGDKVILYGPDGVIALAAAANTIPYVLLCAVTPRVKRHWIDTDDKLRY